MPSVVTRYTQAELLATVVDALEESVADADRRRARVVLEPWRARVMAELETAADDGERALLIDAQRRIDAVLFG